MFSSLLLCVLISLLLKWSFCRYPKLRRRLPPGSMGLPYIGETKHFFSQHPHSFFSKKQERYGDIFKTCILGCPSVMVLKPEAAKMILVTQAHLFKPTYPPTKEKLIGQEALFFHESTYHARLKKLVQASFPPSVLKGSVSYIEKILVQVLQTWELNSTVNVLQEMKKYAFEVAMISAFGYTMEVEVEAIKHLYHALEKGYNSMYLNFPGTPFYRAMKARKSLDEKLKKLIMKRKESRSNCGGLLGMLVGHENEKHNNLTNSQISDNVVGVIFAAHDTTASVLTWLVKYLHDNTQHLEAVTREQEEIRRRILNEDRKLNWEDTRQMPLTSRVIQETLRRASIISFTFREAVEDIEFEGFCIPKGWKVLPVLRSMHYSADFFPQPDNFDPSRFEVSPRANTYMPFGTGVHSCPGSELAKLEMFIFVHHLTINYRWKVMEDNNSIEYGPFPVPKGGLPIILCPRNK